VALAATTGARRAPRGTVRVRLPYPTPGRVRRPSRSSAGVSRSRHRYRHESVVERPRVDTGEPLRNELESFIDAVKTGAEPEVTAEDGIEALKTVQLIDRLAMGPSDDADGESSREPEVEV